MSNRFGGHPPTRRPPKLVARKSVTPSEPSQVLPQLPYRPPQSTSTIGRRKSTRKSQLFDWDDLGLGLDGDVSSRSSAEGSSESDSEPQQSTALRNPTPTGPQPNRDWVRNLTELRKAHIRGRHNFSSRPASMKWLNEQHQALAKCTIPVTLKCVLAASEVSQQFALFRADFMRQEYRTRYWEWAENFISLIDHSIKHGSINSVTSEGSKFSEIVKFIRTARSQKQQGVLLPHKEQLLTSLGLMWEAVEESQPEEEEDEDDSASKSSEDINDANWDSGGKASKWRRNNAIMRRKSKRKQPEAPSLESPPLPDDRDRENSENRPENLPALSDAYGAQSRSAIQEWAKHVVQLRRHFRKGAGYDIPGNQPYLTIWMNAEVARSTTGTLSVYCCGVLKAAMIVEAVESVHINMECETWCRQYVDYIDLFLENQQTNGTRRPSQRLAEFLHTCRIEAKERSLASVKDGLLRGVEEEWLHSSLVRGCSSRIKEKREVSEGSANGERFEGDVVEVVLDSGRYDDEEVTSATAARKRRRRSGAMCQQMVTSMIKGMVAEGISGRARTTDEVEAEEWVSKAGVKALNSYAQNWFRTMTGPPD